MDAVGADASGASRRVKYIPRTITFEWGGAFEGYAKGYVRRNFWRVRELCGSEEDALQECAITFIQCVKRYGHRVDNPAWMMALYKRALAMDWATMSSMDSRLRSIPAPEIQDGVDHNMGALSAAIAGSSTELQKLFSVLAGAPAEFLSLMFNKAELVFSDNPDVAKAAASKLNARVKRLLGIRNASTDVVSELRAVLGR